MAIPGEVTGFTLSSAKGGRDGVVVIFDVAGSADTIEQTRTMWLPAAVAQDLLQQMVKAAIADSATADGVPK